MTEFAQTVSPQLMLILTIAFLAAGFVKGLGGFGMPLISVPIVTLATGVPVTTAMGWSLGPIIVTNLVQVLLGFRQLRVLRRVWPLFSGLILTMLAAVQMLAHLDSNVLSMIVGGMVLLLVAAQLLKPWHVEARWQPLFLVVSGVISGVIGGMTSFFGFPALQAMLAVGLGKDEFVFAVSLMLLSGSLIIGSALGSHGLMAPADLIISAGCVVPALIGLTIGRRGRNRLSVEMFKRVVLVILLGTGSSMVLNGWIG